MNVDFGDDPELRVIFAQDCFERLDRVVELALELERQPDDLETISQLLRDFHTIKGAAQIISLSHVPALAHRLEDLLGGMRAGVRPLAPGDVDAILASADALREMVPLELEGHPVEDLLEAALARLDPLTADQPAPRNPPPAVDPPAAVDPPPAVDPVAPVPAPATPASAALHADLAADASSETVAVPLHRLDRLVNLAGEAITARLRLEHLSRGDRAGPDREEAALALSRALESIQAEALATRMTTVGSLSGTLRRAVREAARSAGKDAQMISVGDSAELDRAVLTRLAEPLLHLVRNAVAHGLETPPVRVGAGKRPTGEVRVEAQRRGGDLFISVRDDGAGLDLDALRARAGRPDLDDADAAELIFSPGLSTAGGVDGLSGRGVGMDVVRKTVEALRGRVQVGFEPGQGSTFTLTVPASLAVIRCLVVAAGSERYGIPAHAVLHVDELPADATVGLEGGPALWMGREIVRVSDLADLLEVPRAAGTSTLADPTGPTLLLAAGGARVAVRVTAVIAQRNLTVKELGPVLAGVPGLAGASLEPDGSVMLVLDAEGLVQAALEHQGQLPAPSPAPTERRSATILVVDDALTVRELQRSMLVRAGYEVITAVDGRDALARMGERRPDLVITDIDMPHLDGIGLLRRLRGITALASVPVMVVTSHASEQDRVAGMQAGADAYLVKQEFDEAALLDAVRRLLGTPR
ncbi:MAG TPA: response regulator [Solirubrobacteraceae bacterium]|nr:response regulator [Solirubrobacteraceae bacterium]